MTLWTWETVDYWTHHCVEKRKEARASVSLHLTHLQPGVASTDPEQALVAFSGERPWLDALHFHFACRQAMKASPELICGTPEHTDALLEVLCENLENLPEAAEALAVTSDAVTEQKAKRLARLLKGRKHLGYWWDCAMVPGAWEFGEAVMKALNPIPPESAYLLAWLIDRDGDDRVPTNEEFATHIGTSKETARTVRDGLLRAIAPFLRWEILDAAEAAAGNSETPGLNERVSEEWQRERAAGEAHRLDLTALDALSDADIAALELPPPFTGTISEARLASGMPPDLVDELARRDAEREVHIDPAWRDWEAQQPPEAPETTARRRLTFLMISSVLARKATVAAESVAERDQFLQSVLATGLFEEMEAAQGPEFAAAAIDILVTHWQAVRASKDPKAYLWQSAHNATTGEHQADSRWEEQSRNWQTWLRTTRETEDDEEE